MAIVSQTTGDTVGSGKTQTLSFTYKVRTSASGGNGQITAQFTTTGKTYPKGSNLDYEVHLTGPGSAFSGSMPTANALHSPVVIASFGPNASSSRSGATGTFEFTVTPAPAPPYLPVQVALSIACQ